MADPQAPARLLTERRGRVLVLTISNPRARNALSIDISGACTPAIEAASADPAVGAIVITGDGGHFCGGGNVALLYQRRSGPRAEQAKSIDTVNAWMRAMRACPKPIIGAVEGAAAGAGFSIALNCDLIVASEEAKFVMSYVKIGVTPDGGGSANLAALVPMQTALEWMLEGGVVGAPRLHALGVVNKVVKPGSALAEAVAWGERLAAGPIVDYGRIKRLYAAARGRNAANFDAQLDLERDTFVEALFADEAGEGMQAFLEKRPARF